MTHASASRILKHAFLHMTPYDPAAAAIISGAMDRMDNARRRVNSARKASRIAVACLECGKKFSVGPTNLDPECPRCHGVDIDVMEV